MALKPIINVQNTIFDANEDYIINFSWSGSQIFSTQLLVTSPTDPNIIYYDDIITENDEGFVLSQYILPANTLTNGSSYIFQIKVVGKNNIESDLSDKVIFRCITTPTFEFSTIPTVIDSSQYDFCVNYVQTESELLKEYQYYLYNKIDGRLLKSSGIIYSTASSPEIQISYIIEGLENEGSYIIICEGITVNGFHVKTSEVAFSVEYEKPALFALLDVKCNSKNGYIEYGSNINVIENVSTDLLEIVDGTVNLDGKSIIYQNSFSLSKDFVLCQKFGIINTDIFSTKILEINNGVDSINLFLNNYDDGQRLKLTATNAVDEYIIYSEPYEIAEADLVTVWIKRIGIYYDLNVTIEKNYFSE